MKKLIFAFICLLSAIPCEARIISVDDDGLADFNNIQAAIDDANDSDVVIVQPGLYGEDVNFLGKNITLTSTNPINSQVVATTIIGRDDGYEAFVMFDGSEDPNCVLMGFEINGSILGNNTHATISHCVLQGNCAHCGELIVEFNGTISNCVITDNPGDCPYWCPMDVRPMILCHSAFIKNCTIVNNEGLGAPAVNVHGTTTMLNCIIYGNNGGESQIGASGTLSVRYCNVEGGLAAVSGNANINWGPGNIDTDPCFVESGYWDNNDTPGDANDDFWVDGDYHLKSEGWRWDTQRKIWTWDDVTSRCIDAGNPGSPLGEELLTVPVDPNNEWGQNLRINMGAFGGTAEASMPPYDWALLADLTNDGTVNFEDYAAQAIDWMESESEQPGDLNQDGTVDIADLALLTEDWLKQTSWYTP